MKNVLDTNLDEIVKLYNIETKPGSPYPGRLDGVTVHLPALQAFCGACLASCRAHAGNSSCSIADIGCGTGRDLPLIQGWFRQYGSDAMSELSACDPCPEMCKLANNKGFQTHCTDALSFLLPQPNAFDGLWAHFSLIHLNENEWMESLSNILTAIKRQGVLAMGVKCGDGHMHLDPAGGANLVARPTLYYNRNALISFMRDKELFLLWEAEMSGDNGPSVPLHTKNWFIFKKESCAKSDRDKGATYETVRLDRRAISFESLYPTKSGID